MLIVLAGIALGVLIAVARRRLLARRARRSADWMDVEGLPSRLRDPETGELL